VASPINESGLASKLNKKQSGWFLCLVGCAPSQQQKNCQHQMRPHAKPLGLQKSPGAETLVHKKICRYWVIFCIVIAFQLESRNNTIEPSVALSADRSR
jgi:hypothetical protein